MIAKNLTQKILTIVAAAIILVSFFLPWISVWGMNGSAAEIITKIAESLEYIHDFDEDNFYILLPFLLLAMPICSVIMIIIQSVSKNARALRFPKIFMMIVMLLFLVLIIYLEEESRSNGRVIETLSTGFYLTLINVIYLFVTVFFNYSKFSVVESKPSFQKNPSSTIYCSNCGKSAQTLSNFCENCGAKL
ncbi:MAG TPA: zinc ribbon domain-containing protein [Bacteroidales bacterium]|nr:zinc ribbon domain-containing protein [Bacteroidales bacterium]